MKLIHLSDLHLGKRVNEFSMVEDQKYILNEILKIIDQESPDGILLAGTFMTDPFHLRRQCSFLIVFLPDLRSERFPFLLSVEIMTVQRESLLDLIL